MYKKRQQNSFIWFNTQNYVYCMPPEGRALLNFFCVCVYCAIGRFFFQFVYVFKQPITFIFLKMFDLFHFISFPRHIPLFLGHGTQLLLVHLADSSMSSKNQPLIDTIINNNVWNELDSLGNDLKKGSFWSQR